jgi:hypothetical protein
MMNKLSRSPMVAEGEAEEDLHHEGEVGEDKVKSQLNVTSAISLNIIRVSVLKEEKMLDMLNKMMKKKCC